jgi:hypothetical protein
VAGSAAELGLSPAVRGDNRARRSGAAKPLSVLNTMACQIAANFDAARRLGGGGHFESRSDFG